MRGATEATPVARAEAQMAAGRWEEAFALLHAADAETPLDVGGLDALARAAYGSGELEAAIWAWERAHGELVSAGRHREAAGPAATIAMYLMMDTGLMAPVRGWIGRAERLLEGAEASAVHAVLALTRTYERIMCGDLASARRWAERAVELGLAHGAPPAVAIGRTASARLRIFDGEIEEGLRLLDEVAVTLVSGELDPLATGMVYCELICAMQGLAQYDRAQQWTEAMDRWRDGVAFGGINGRCRVHRAEMLRLKGDCEEAETEALHACRELRPWMRREYGWPLTELGTIRLRRGDLAGAEEAFVAAHTNGWDPQPGLALVRLAQGAPQVAAEMLADALAHPVRIPSKERPPNEPLRRAPLLDAEVVVALAAGFPDRARRAAAELEDIAGIFRSNALVATAALARARVALRVGDEDTAVGGAQTAVAAWCEVGAPYETAVARTVLAAAHRASGRAELGDLEERLAREGLERIGAELPGGASPGEERSSSPPPPAGATFRRDGDTREIEFDGTAVRLHDLKGFRYLERLLASPGRELHVLDLVAGERAEAPGSRTVAREEDLSLRVGEDDLGPVLDAQAKAAYKRRLAEVEEDIEEADRLGDRGRRELAEADREFLLRELTSAVGLGGRHRRTGGSAERARTSVTRALRYGIARIGEHHPALAEHLDRSVVTGTYCRYVPDGRNPIDWGV